MEELGKKEEKALLVGVKTFKNEKTFDESMLELVQLTETAGATVVGKIIQNRQEIDRRTYIGKGKVEEVLALIQETQAEMVIFNHELTPRQLNILEKTLGVQVVDRVQLILDIFARHSTSKEGKLQVELAQLKYLTQRLSGGSGLVLSRQAGGIGSRGPGETKLETDRRHIKYRISLIKNELKESIEHRKRLREKRKASNIFQIGLIGYTNAGKSTVLNLLTQAETLEKDKLFATLDPLTKKWTLKSGLEVVVTDTVGFIQDLPTQLVEAFHSTLEVVQDMDLLLHVVDASHKAHLVQEEVVAQILRDLQVQEIPVVTIYNKKDQTKEDFEPTLFPNVHITARDEAYKEVLEKAVLEKMQDILFFYDTYLSISAGKILYDLKRETICLFEEYEEEKNAYHVKGYAKKETRWEGLLR